MSTIEAQWTRHSRHEQQLAVAIYNGTDGVGKVPPWRDLSVEERQPFLDWAREQMNTYLAAGRN